MIWPCVSHVTQWRSEGASSAVRVLLDQYPWSGPGYFWEGSLQYVAPRGEDKAALIASAFRPGQITEAPTNGRTDAPRAATSSQDLQNPRNFKAVWCCPKPWRDHELRTVGYFHHQLRRGEEGSYICFNGSDTRNSDHRSQT